MSIEISSVVPEKDILAKDLFTNTGILLLKAGTVLTRSFKEKLKGFGIIGLSVL